MFDDLPPLQPPLALQQSPQWTRALQRLGVGAVEIRVDGLPVQVIRRSLPILGDTAMIAHAQLTSLPCLRRRLGVRNLIVSAPTEMQGAGLAEAGFVRIAAPRTSARLSIHRETGARRAALRANWRNQLRRAERSALTFRSCAMAANADHWFFLNEAVAQRDKRYRSLPVQLLCSFAKAHPGAARLFTAYLGRRPVAGALILRHGGSATYQMAWTDPIGREHHATNHLLWQAMSWLACLGVGTLDLGLCDRQRSPGLAHFKLGTGAVPHRDGGTWIDSGLAGPLHRGLRALRGASRSPRARRHETQTRT